MEITIRGRLSKPVQHRLAAPVQPDEEPVGYALNSNNGKYYAVYDREESSIWDKPFYTKLEQVPDGYVMKDEVTIVRKRRPKFKPLKENEEPVAVLADRTNYLPLYNRKYETSRQKKITKIMEMKERGKKRAQFEEDLKQNPKVIMFPKKK